jgi:uncharacterized protein YggE
MNRIILATIALLFTASTSSPAFAAGSDNSTSARTITTQGDAMLNVEPDMFRIVFTLKARDRQLVEAFAETEKTTSSVCALAKTYGLVPNDVQIGKVTVRTNVGGYSSVTSQTGGYEVSREISFIVRDKTLIPKFLRDGFAAGASSLYSLTLDVSDLKKQKDEVRVLALKAAKDKADLLAGALNLKVGRALQIGDASTTGESGTDIGKIPVAASVNATFELE